MDNQIDNAAAVRIPIEDLSSVQNLLNIDLIEMTTAGEMKIAGEMNNAGKYLEQFSGSIFLLEQK
jgi:hypothetical protein